MIYQNEIVKFNMTDEERKIFEEIDSTKSRMIEIQNNELNNKLYGG